MRFMMVFRFLCKTDCKKVNWAEQIAMERRKIIHELKEFLRSFRKQQAWILIFAGISTNV